MLIYGQVVVSSNKAYRQGGSVELMTGELNWCMSHLIIDIDFKL